MSKLYAGIYVFCLVAFGILGYLAYQLPYFTGDSTISQWIQRIDFPFFAPLMENVSTLGTTIPAIVTVLGVVGVLWFFGRKLEIIFVTALPSVAALLNYLFKLLIDRARPSGSSLSFPSGHTTYAVTLFGFLFYLTPRLIKKPALIVTLRCLLGLLILLTGVSRVYLGAHWPGDILGSLLLGGLLLAPAITLYHNYIRGHKKKIREIVSAGAA